MSFVYSTPFRIAGFLLCGALGTYAGGVMAAHIPVENLALKPVVTMAMMGAGAGGFWGATQHPGAISAYVIDKICSPFFGMTGGAIAGGVLCGLTAIAAEVCALSLPGGRDALTSVINAIWQQAPQP